MNKESLIKARELIIDTLNKSDINKIDKIELMINLYLFLNEDEYDYSIKVLEKSINCRRRTKK